MRTAITNGGRQMTSKDIQRALVRYRYDVRRVMVLRNCCFTGFEADLLVIQPSGYVTEIEIKISVSDYLNEFRAETKKEKHLRLKAAMESGLCKKKKHNPNLIKHFYYAFPQELWPKISQKEMPEYAGVLLISRSGVKEVRRPMQLACVKSTEEQQIAMLRGCYFRDWTAFMKGK